MDMDMDMDLPSYVEDKEVKAYFLTPPFDPPALLPELPFVKHTAKENNIYKLVQKLFLNMGLDKQHKNSDQWNPLGEVVKPGQTVVIKPNLVTDKHILDPSALYSTISHGSMIRPVIDYIYKALDGEGKIIIADNPVEGTDFHSLMDFTGIQAMVKELTIRGYKGLEVMDLRPKILKEAKNGEFYYVEQQGDPLGYVTIDLGKDSMFGEFDSNPTIHYYTLADKTVDHIDPNFIGPSITDRYHNSEQHTYIISNTVLSADLVINMAKMKSHCKSGVSMALKNMIGVVYEKHCMPHHRPGSPPNGDSFLIKPPDHYIAMKKSYLGLKKYFFIHHIPGITRFRNWLQKKKIVIGAHIEHGNWKGNDTIWRTILDLNRIVQYADGKGTMINTPQRKILSFVDGIISQQGEGPMAGEAIPTSILFGGFNPILVDALAIKSMGIDYALFKTISQGRSINKWPLVSAELDLSLPNINPPLLNYKLSKGWC